VGRSFPRSPYHPHYPGSLAAARRRKQTKEQDTTCSTTRHNKHAAKSSKTRPKLPRLKKETSSATLLKKVSPSVSENCLFDLFYNLHGRALLVIQNVTIPFLPYKPLEKEDNPSINLLLLLGGHLADQGNPISNTTFLKRGQHLIHLKRLGNFVPDCLGEIAFRN
jgi:hypothetical protein